MTQLHRIIADCVFREQQPYTLAELRRARIAPTDGGSVSAPAGSSGSDVSLLALRDYLLSLRINNSPVFQQDNARYFAHFGSGLR